MIQIPSEVTDKNLLKYSPYTKLKLDCTSNLRSQTLNPYTYAPIGQWNPQPQFWYKEKSPYKGPSWPVGNPDDYRFSTIVQTQSSITFLREVLQIENINRYIPGEIYKNKIPKEAIDEPPGCPDVWEPKRPEVFFSKFDESTLEQRPLLIDSYKENKKLAEQELLIQESFEKIDHKRETFKPCVKLMTTSNKSIKEESEGSLNEKSNLQIIRNKDEHKSCATNYIISSETTPTHNEIKRDIRGPDTRFSHLAAKNRDTTTNTTKTSGRKSIKNDKCRCGSSKNDKRVTFNNKNKLLKI